MAANNARLFLAFPRTHRYVSRVAIPGDTAGGTWGARQSTSAGVGQHSNHARAYERLAITEGTCAARRA